MTELVYLSAKQALKQLQQGSLTSVELLDAYLARIEHFNPHFNAVIATNIDAARERARSADEARQRGESWGPLHGLPMTIKDTYEVVGMPTTSGAAKLRHYYPKQNAVAVQRLIDAGAIIVGKTNVPLFAADLQSYNDIYGTTNNPWDVERTPGGSSGGAAAALAAGFTPLELGSDIGGSIRTPAHYCGVYGLKTTHGIVPLRGHIPGPPGALSEPDLAVSGPLARHAEDLTLVLDTVCGPLPDKADALHIRLPAARQKKLSEFRVLAWFDDPLCTIDSEIRTNYQHLVDTLREQGVSVQVSGPNSIQLKDIFALYLNLLGSVMGTSNAPRERRLMGWVSPLVKRLERRLNLAPMLNHFLAGASQSHVEWLKHHEKRLRLAQKFTQATQDFDVVLMPITPTTAIPHQQKLPMPLRSLMINGQLRNYMEHLIWISPATLFGFPAVSAPVGISKSQLPINVQIMARPYHDKTAIRFAALLEKVYGGFNKPHGMN